MVKKVEVTLAKATLSYIVNQIMSKEETFELRKIFQQLDVNNDGRLSFNEIVEGFRKIGTSLNPEQDAKKVFERVDFDANGFISYEEFLSATANFNIILCENKIELAFKAFDKNGDGSISSSELKEILGKGINISDKVWEDIVKEVDINQDGEVLEIF